MRNLLLLLLFSLSIPITLFASFYAMTYHTHKTVVLGISTSATIDRPIAYAALPTTENLFAGNVTYSGDRTAILNQFLTRYHSPLAPYASLLVNKADEYRIDFRLLTAIAMQETTLCKTTLPDAPFNCWGWGIYGKTVTNFSSFTEAIDTISHYFGNRRERGIVTLDSIAAIYNPANSNNWKQHVSHFMNEM